MRARFQWIAPLVTLLAPVVLLSLSPAVVVAQVGPMSPCGGPDITIAPSAVTQDNYRGPFTAVYTVANNCTTAFTALEMSCELTGPLSCGTVHPATRGSLTPGQSFKDTVTYSTGAPGSGTLLLRVDWDAGGPGYGTLWVTVQAVTPPTVTLVTPVLTSGSRAVVRNRTPMLRATILKATYPLDTTKTALLWRTDTVSKWRADTFTVARWNRGLMEWEVDSTLGLNGAGADSALVTVRACDTHSFCTIVTRYAVLPNDSTAVLSWLGTPTGTLGASFGASFGPGLGVSGAELETGFSTIPYFAMGSARSAGLVYSTRQSYPRVLVPVHVQLRWPTVGTPDQMVVRLFDGATKLDSLKLASPSCSTGSVLACRGVLQGDFSGTTFPTPTRKWLKVEVEVTKGAVTKLSSDSVEAVLVDRRSAMYSSGWWPSAFLKLVQAGSDRLLISPTGTASIYRGNGDSLYLPPAGSFVGLIKTASGWELRARGDSAVLRFDSNGRLRAAQDRNNNVDSLIYGASGLDTLKTLRDPTAHTITFGYASGLLSTITDAASRVTKVTIGASNQLTYDSLPSPTATPITNRYLYQAYPGTNTNVLTKRIGVILDTTIVVYDSTFKRRAVQAQLPLVQNPAGSWVKPTISYTAVERRGFGALVRTDSAGPYVEIKDPLNHWTRSWLNRWGQARLSWDTLGLLGRSRFADDGRVLWSQGKIGGDTTRTYFSYDSFQRLAKSYINRIENGKGILRLDSLLYDANHRVVKRVDSRGQADSITYDTRGNVLNTRDPAGYSTAYWYRTNGLVDSVRSPGSNVKTWFRYDGTWLQRVAIRLGSASGSTLLDSTSYDSYGRAAASLQKIRVRIATGVTPKWQWRKSVPYYRVTNQTDSSVVFRTDECTDPCNTPPSFGTDAAHTIKVGFRFDRAGRDTLRLVSNDTAKATRYLYDRLDRLVSRRPPSALPTPPRDSTVYDLAGNLVKTITRRGDTIVTVYDSRNRSTTTAVPGVGTYTRVYGGPLNQLTRWYLASPVDSIGGVNGEVRYGYDRRGRLLADTSYTGATARATTRLYDQYERDSVATAPVGAWTVRYEAQRGIVSGVLTPLGDSTAYFMDGEGRQIARYAQSSGPLQIQSVDYTATGGTARIQHSVGGTWKAGIYDPEAAVDDTTAAIPLRPLWVEQHGSGTTPDSLIDSLRYDGWERLLSWRQYENPPPHWAQVASDTMSFDVDGNVLTPTGSESYDAKTGRLLSRIDDAGWTWTYTYDAAGNQTQVAGVKAASTDTWKYLYDATDRLVSVRRRLNTWPAESLVARYGYDVLGRRIVKRVYSASTPAPQGYTRFSYAGNQVAFETDSGTAGITGNKYTWGLDVDDLVGFRAASGVDYVVVQDQLKSVRGLVKRDGTWIMSQRFTPYGKVLSTSGTGPALSYSWTGREYDQETGLYFNRARYYDPGQRRFTQEDPIGFGGGANLYAYVGGKVLDAKDPYGLDWIPILDEITTWGYPDPTWHWASGGGGEYGSNHGAGEWMDALDPRNQCVRGIMSACPSTAPNRSERGPKPECEILQNANCRGRSPLRAAQETAARIASLKCAGYSFATGVTFALETAGLVSLGGVVRGGLALATAGTIRAAAVIAAADQGFVRFGKNAAGRVLMQSTAAARAASMTAVNSASTYVAAQAIQGQVSGGFLPSGLNPYGVSGALFDKAMEACQ